MVVLFKEGGALRDHLNKRTSKRGNCHQCHVLLVFRTQPMPPTPLVYRVVEPFSYRRMILFALDMALGVEVPTDRFSFTVCSRY